MKKIILLLSAILVLSACSDETISEPEIVEVQEEATEEPTQEELNAQMKEEAIEIDFVAANGGELEDGTRVKATGTLFALDLSGLRGGDFMLSVESGEDSFGVYHITNFNTAEIALEEGQTVTVYGSFQGKNDSGMPHILTTIIE